jgi:hypothetical protein
MSNYLAVAAVTSALRQIIDDEVSGLIPGAQVNVTHVRPGGETASTPETGVNVFLYGVSSNPQWRNNDLPTRRNDGTLVQRPQAALDLHYLISFYGVDKTLEAQRLLGGVVRALHARPTLTRQTLQSVIEASEGGWLGGSDMAEALEPVRFTPVPLSLEELSKLWSVLFQTPYALSLAYQASVVLVEAETTTSPSLPTRGRNVYVVPFRQVVIGEVMPEEGPRAPIVATSTVTIQGRGLRGDVTHVRIGEELAEPTSVSDGEVVLPLSAIPADRLRAGVRSVQVVHQRLMGTPPTPHLGDESNVAAIVLRPVIIRKAEDPASPEVIEHEIEYISGSDPEPPRLRVKVTPEVGTRQRVLLLLNRIAPEPGRAYSVAAPSRDTDTNTLEFDVSDVEPGTYLVRIQVDGAESLLLPQDSGPYTHPQVVI